jgi:hypothetical protein
MTTVPTIRLAVVFVFTMLLSLMPRLSVLAHAERPYLRIDPEAHTSSITRLSTDKTGKYLVSSSKDKTARLWDLESNKLLRTFRPPIGPGFEGFLYAVAISPDASMVATGGVDRRTYLFQRESGRLVKVLDQAAAVLHLEYSPDGRFLVVALAGKQGFIVYETSTYSVTAHGKDATGSTYYANWDNHNHIATASDDGFISLYILEAPPEKSLKLITRRHFDRRHPRTAVFSSDGQKIAVGFAKTSHVEVISASNLVTRYEMDVKDCSKNGLQSSLVAFAWTSNDQTLYGGGECQRSRGRTFIRAWKDEAKGTYEDYRVSQDSIEHMVPLKDGSVVFASNDPLIGILSPQGSLHLLSNSSIPDYRGMEDNFLVNDTGSVIEVALERGREPVRFAVMERQVMTRSAFDVGADSLSAPSRSVKRPGLLGLFGKRDELSVTDWKNNSSPKLNGKALDVAPKDISRSLAIAPAEDSFVIGTESALQCYDRTGRILWRVSVMAPAWNLNITRNGSLAVAALGDGTIRWYRMHDGEEMAAFLLLRNRTSWVLWTPNGYFDAEQTAENLIGWHLNQGKNREALYYPISRFFDTFYRPDIISKTFDNSFSAHELTALGASEDPITILESKRIPPSVQIRNYPSTSAEEKVQIDVEAVDEGGGVDEIRLFVNGKVLDHKTRGIQVVALPQRQAYLKERIDIDLLEGDNHVRAVAYSRDRIEGLAAEVMIKYTGMKNDSVLHLVVIGINEYLNSELNLDFAKIDAEGIVSHFAGHPSSLFKAIHHHKMFDQEATKEAILRRLRSLQPKASDAVILFLGGHGETDGTSWYFVPYELTAPENVEQLREKGLSSNELQEEIVKIGAAKILVLLDSCKSGAALSAFNSRGLDYRKALVQLVRASGAHVVAASTKDQEASEVKDLGHGVFTYTILQGMQGGADGSPKDQVVTVRELLSYVESQLPDISLKYKTKAQFPVAYSMGNDFPIGVIP